MAAQADDDDEGITGINITPLVDIILVLLIIFMMTASYIVTPAIEVNLPKAANAEANVQSTLSLVITKEGRVFLNNREVRDEDVREYIRSERRKGAELEAVIAADGAVLHRRVVSLIDLMKGEGIVKFAINTEADFSAPEPEREEERPPE
jgi:biopolymer transport protein ExbD